MTNPFEDNDGIYLVLINEELQYSLWPAFADVPPGWKNRQGGIQQAGMPRLHRNPLDRYAPPQPRGSHGGVSIGLRGEVPVLIGGT